MLSASLFAVCLVVFKAQAAVTAVTSMEFEASVLQDLGIGIQFHATADPLPVGQAGFAAVPSPGLSFDASGGDFEGFSGGVMRHHGGLTLSISGSAYSLLDFELRVAANPLDLELFDASGQRWFLFEDSQPEVVEGALHLRNMDINMAPELAALLGRPDLAGTYLGSAELRVPAGSAVIAPRFIAKGAACADVFNADRDVTLIDLGTASQVAREAAGRIAVSYSAQLRNTGTSAVLWKRSIEPDGTAGNVGEHPFLALSMYRILNGRITQIGRADVKHAFFSANTNCSCAGAQIIYPTCEDIYGSTTNSNRQFMAPREEVTASTGAWSRVGSHFDGSPADDYRDHGGNTDHDDFEHRLVVAESDLQTGGSYFVEAWYIIPDDVDLFNSMGHDPVTPAFAGSTWSFAAGGSLEAGSILDEFVDPASPPTGSASAFVDTGEGRLQLAVVTSDAGGSLVHYEYALMNFDFDRQVDSFSLPLPPGAAVSNIGFSDGDGNAGNDWAAVTGPYDITWTAPGGNEMDWGMLYSFGFDADVSAVDTKIDLGVVEPGTPSKVSFVTLGPAAADNDRDGSLDSADPDDDNDGVLDVDEPGGDADNPHAFDPDRDDDGIIDGLDRDPGSALNNLCIGEAPDAFLSESIAGIATCADPGSVTTLAPPASVTGTGDLLIISPSVIFDSEFFVVPGGKLGVISRDPTAPIQSP